jgi:RimJ/RimL family protein N-acetyltransferase
VVTPVLRTERLLLEPYVPADEDDFTALFQDERVSRWMGDGPKPEAADRALFGRVFTVVYPHRRFDVWAVRSPGGRLVGHAEIKSTEAVGGHEIVYALAADVWGRGYGTELAAALTEYGFTALDLPVVHATVAEPNAASLAVLRRVGYRRLRHITEDDGSTTVVLACRRADRDHAG